MRKSNHIVVLWFFGTVYTCGRVANAEVFESSQEELYGHLMDIQDEFKNFSRQ